MRTHNPKHNRFGRTGFTLIEVLIVITIIGILIGLLIPAVGIAYRRVKQSALVLEVATISDAVEKYKNKFGDYPPDGSNAGVLTRHMRKIFPQIAASELQLLTVADYCNSSTYSSAVMDPPEALVFFLGGFSENPIFPLSGVGGPFFLSNAAGQQVTSGEPFVSVQYNVDRNAPFFEFNQEQLSLDVSSGVTVSSDETEYFLGTANDRLPVYRHPGAVAPIVYFDHRSYTLGPRLYNFYGSANQPFGRVLPYRSDNLKTTSTDPDIRFRYVNEKSFQIISAGLDDEYGGFADPAAPARIIFYRFPSGQSLEFTAYPTVAPTGPFSGYKSGEDPSAQLDNATNFAEGILGDQLEN